MVKQEAYNAYFSNEGNEAQREKKHVHHSIKMGRKTLWVLNKGVGATEATTLLFVRLF
jgi:hypothetical protein